MNSQTKVENRKEEEKENNNNNEKIRTNCKYATSRCTGRNHTNKNINTAKEEEEGKKISKNKKKTIRKMCVGANSNVIRHQCQ